MSGVEAEPGQGQLILPGDAGPRKKKKINLLNRSPSPVILEDYGALEPTRCTVGGPGIAGGVVGVPTKVNVTARDASSVHIREGGEKFILRFVHTSKGSAVKTYESHDHGDGHYTFSGVRADLKGMHQLSVEVNGTLVGDSPYLIMFEIDDDAELTTENADGTAPVARKSAAASIKERIVFVQHMNPAMSEQQVLEMFEKFGKVLKCEKLLPAQDIWMIQYSSGEDASEAVTLNTKEVMGCPITAALASHLGGVGTHPTIMQQLQHIQAMHLQEQHSTSWATQLAQQRASIRQAGGEVEELTDTRKRRKALALMQMLQAKVEKAKIAAAGEEKGASDGRAGSDAAGDLRHRPRKSDRDDDGLREKERDSRDSRERSKARDKDRDRDRERERDRGRRSRERDRERERDRGRERDRERDRERERERERNKDRERRGREREREEWRRHDREREGREKDRGREKRRREGGSERDSARERRRDEDVERSKGGETRSERQSGSGRDKERGRERERDRPRDKDRRRGEGKSSGKSEDVKDRRDTSSRRDRDDRPIDKGHEKDHDKEAVTERDQLANEGKGNGVAGSPAIEKSSDVEERGSDAAGEDGDGTREHNV